MEFYMSGFHILGQEIIFEVLCGAIILITLFLFAVAFKITKKK